MSYRCSSSNWVSCRYEAQARGGTPFEPSTCGRGRRVENEGIKLSARIGNVDGTRGDRGRGIAGRLVASATAYADGDRVGIFVAVIVFTSDAEGSVAEDAS